jgi:hypothetical protein
MMPRKNREESMRSLQPTSDAADLMLLINRAARG